jgi:hypothetical protein
MTVLAMLLRTVIGFQLGPCFKRILPVASVFAYFVSFAVVISPVLPIDARSNFQPRKRRKKRKKRKDSADAADDAQTNLARDDALCKLSIAGSGGGRSLAASKHQRTNGMHAESSSVSWAMVAQPLGPGDPGRSLGLVARLIEPEDTRA